MGVGGWEPQRGREPTSHTSHSPRARQGSEPMYPDSLLSSPEETEAQRREMTRPGSHGQQMAEPGLQSSLRHGPCAHLLRHAASRGASSALTIPHRWPRLRTGLGARAESCGLNTKRRQGPDPQQPCPGHVGKAPEANATPCWDFRRSLWLVEEFSRRPKSLGGWSPDRMGPITKGPGAGSQEEGSFRPNWVPSEVRSQGGTLVSSVCSVGYLWGGRTGVSRVHLFLPVGAQQQPRAPAQTPGRAESTFPAAALPSLAGLLPFGKEATGHSQGAFFPQAALASHCLHARFLSRSWE